MVQVEQLDFLAFFDQLEEGVFAEYPVSSEDIGGELLAILSHGLYTNPLDAIREYVQNAVDAKATEVTIQITGNSVWIQDDGLGMSLMELHEARQFGVSKKSIGEHVGFRGIGIYSGFDLCNHLRITTKQSGLAKAYILEFDFGQMKSILENARKDPDRPAVPLIQLLSDHSRFGFSQDYPLDKSFSIVELEDINDVHLRRLSNREELRDYVLRNLPIDFDPDFEHRFQINANLKRHIKGYNPIRVILKSNGEEDEIVVKPNIPDLGPPITELVRSIRGKELAYYWACLTNGSSSLGKQGFPEYAGFVYKVKGFTIGNREKLRNMFSGKKQLYPWYTGEVYVLDEDITPNAERDDFETNAAKTALETTLKQVFSSDDRSLENIAKEAQMHRRAKDQIDKFDEILASLETKISKQTYDTFKLYSELDEIHKKLRYQKGRAPEDYANKAEALITRIDELQSYLREELESGTSVKEQKKQKTAKAPIEEPQPVVEEEIGSESVESGPEDYAEARESVEGPTEGLELPKLYELFEGAGWELDEDCQVALQIVQDALLDTLGERLNLYRDLMEDIEGRIREELEE